MTTFGLGVELDTAVVRWAAMTDITGDPIEAHMQPVVVVADGRALAGSAATDVTRDQPGNVVTDVVGQFVVDRLWFAGGLMLTPDEAMRSIISACAADASRQVGDAAGAVTIACPGAWEQAALERIAAIVAELGLPLPSVRSAVSATTAAADAASRIVRRPQGEAERPDLPVLPAGIVAPRRGEVSAPLPAPQPTGARNRGIGRWAWVAVVIVIPVLVVVAIRAWREPGGDADEGSRGSTPTTQQVSAGPADVTVAPTAPPSALTIGVLLTTGPETETGVRAEVDSLVSDSAVFPAGLFVVVQPVAKADETIAQMLGQGVTAVVSDPAGPMVDDVVSAARTAGIPLCLVGGAPELDAVAGRGVAIGDPRTCTQLMALASVSAHSTLPARLLDALNLLVGGTGLECSSFRQCAAYLDADQPISFEPEGGNIRLAPQSEDGDQ